MKTEIECRLLECDVKNMLKKLNNAGAVFVGDWLQQRYCYDFTPVNPNSWIRLRTNGKETTLTIKEIASNAIDGTKESEIIVSDFETTDEILNKLGYVARSKQENRRIRFLLDNVEIDIDFWPQIPAFVEFEGSSKESIERVLDKLGYEFSQTTTLDVSSIYLHYGIDISKTPVLQLEDDRKIKSSALSLTKKTLDF